jgi:hypothetical protein
VLSSSIPDALGAIREKRVSDLVGNRVTNPVRWPIRVEFDANGILPNRNSACVSYVVTSREGNFEYFREADWIKGRP